MKDDLKIGFICIDSVQVRFSGLRIFLSGSSNGSVAVQLGAETALVSAG